MSVLVRSKRGESRIRRRRLRPAGRSDERAAATAARRRVRRQRLRPHPPSLRPRAAAVSSDRFRTRRCTPVNAGSYSRQRSRPRSAVRTAAAPRPGSAREPRCADDAGRRRTRCVRLRRPTPTAPSGSTASCSGFRWLSRRRLRACSSRERRTARDAGPSLQPASQTVLGWRVTDVDAAARELRARGAASCLRGTRAGRARDLALAQRRPGRMVRRSGRQRPVLTQR